MNKKERNSGKIKECRSFLPICGCFISIIQSFAGRLESVAGKIDIVIYEMMYRIYFGLDVYEELRYSARYYYD